LLLLTGLTAASAYSLAASANGGMVSALNDLAWAVVVLSSWPRAMLIMAGSFGFWRAGLISNGLFAVAVGVVLMGVLGGTTWLSGGFWAPDGLYSAVIWPVAGLAWVVVASRVVGKAPATRTGW